MTRGQIAHLYKEFDDNEGDKLWNKLGGKDITLSLPELETHFSIKRYLGNALKSVAIEQLNRSERIRNRVVPEIYQIDVRTGRLTRVNDPQIDRLLRILSGS